MNKYCICPLVLIGLWQNVMSHQILELEKQSGFELDLSETLEEKTLARSKGRYLASELRSVDIGLIAFSCNSADRDVHIKATK